MKSSPSLLATLGFVLAMSAVACGPSRRRFMTNTPDTAAAPAPVASSSATANQDTDTEDGDCKDSECIPRCDKRKRLLDCTKAGDALRNGEGVKANPVRAMKMYEKACEKKGPDACYWLADLLANEEVTGHDEARAVETLDKACEYGNGQGCDTLSGRYEKGQGVKKDHARAVELLGKGCAATDFQVWTCNSLRTLVDKRDKDATKLAAEWKKACTGGDAKACTAQERMLKK